MDTIYAEGQRRYVESLSAYARQFVDKMQKPRLDHIEGLSPAIAIEQKHSRPLAPQHGRHGHRNLRLSADPRVPAGPAALPGLRPARRHADGRRDHRQDHAASRRHAALLMAPLEIEVGEKYETFGKRCDRADTSACGSTARPTPLDKPPPIDRRRKHRVEVVIDRVDHPARRAAVARWPAAWKRMPWPRAACCT